MSVSASASLHPPTGGSSQVREIITAVIEKVKRYSYSERYMSEAGEAGLSQPPSVLQPEVQPVQIQEKPEIPILRRLEDVLKLSEPQTESAQKREPEADPLSKSESAIVEKRNPVKEFFTPLKNKIFKLLSRKEQTAPETRKRTKDIIFRYGIAVATALSAQILSSLPAQASNYGGYEVKPIVQNYLNEDEPPVVLTAADYHENLPKNYYGPTISHLYSAEMGSAVSSEDLIFNLPGNRSVAAWELLTNNLNAENNPRYQAREGKTFCNFYLRDALRQFGIPIPVEYINPATNEVKPTLANNIYDRLTIGSFTSDNPGDNKEWHSLDRETAQKLADAGYPVVIAVKNTDGPGHVAILAPRSIHDYENVQRIDPDNKNENVLVVAQAGAKSGLVEWDETHYSEENGYSELKFFLSSEDMENIEYEAKNVNWESRDPAPVLKPSTTITVPKNSLPERGSSVHQ